MLSREPVAKYTDLINSIQDEFDHLKIPNTRDVSQYKNNIRNLVQNLLASIIPIEKYFPVSTTTPVNVLSLGCDLPHEYLALRAFYGNIHTEFNFVGVDINDFGHCDEYINLFKDELFSNFKMHIGDGSSIPTLRKLLEESGTLPKDGFDLIIVRHPEILKNPAFKKMFETVIPYFSAKSAKVFTTTYYENEWLYIKDLTVNTNSQYYKSPGSHNGLIRNEGCKIIADNPRLVAQLSQADKYASIVTCAGYALKYQKYSENKNFFFVNHHRCDDYVKSLEKIIGEGPKTGTHANEKLVHRKNNSQVQLSRFWINEVAKYNPDNISKLAEGLADTEEEKSALEKVFLYPRA